MIVSFFIVNVLLQWWVYIFGLPQHEGYAVLATDQVFIMLDNRHCDITLSETDEQGDFTLSPTPTPPPSITTSPSFCFFYFTPLWPPPPRPLGIFVSPASLPLSGLSVELHQQVWQRPRLSRKMRGLKAQVRAVQHVNVPSADKRAFNTAALVHSWPSVPSLSISPYLPLVLFYHCLILFLLCCLFLCLFLV